MGKNDLVGAQKRYMTVLASFMPEGMELSCWMAVDEFWKSEISSYTHNYTYKSDTCEWFIHSNVELTAKLIIAVGEYGQKICDDTIRFNNNRKVENYGKSKRA